MSEDFSLFSEIFAWLIGRGFESTIAVFLARGSIVLLAIILSVLAYYATFRIIIRLAVRGAENTTTKLDDALIDSKLFQRLALLVPAGVVTYLTPIAFDGPLYEDLRNLIYQGINLYIAIMLTLAALSLVTAVVTVISRYSFAKELPVEGFSQLLSIIVIIFGAVSIISLVIGENPFVLLSGLSALAAVLSFIYQDALRGLVAGIQLTANRMLSRGDYISVPGHGALGSVMEIGLTTIKIRNDDFTITTVPTNDLITSSFKNYRGIADGSGRRLKRSITIDLNSVGFASDALIERLKTRPQLASFFEAHAANDNRKRLTNLTLFRTYLDEWLRENSLINEELTLMVRLLDPTAHGVPVELYAFTREKRWVQFEQFLSELFEELIATIPEFDLRAYQAPSRIWTTQPQEGAHHG